ncbi:hypothetical protein J6590_089095, partial [Homalodisca vitripennis]
MVAYSSCEPHHLPLGLECILFIRWGYKNKEQKDEEKKGIKGFKHTQRCLVQALSQQRMQVTNTYHENEKHNHRSHHHLQSMRKRNPPHLRPTHDRNVNDRINSLMIAYHLLCEAIVWTLSPICFLCMVVSSSSDVTQASYETNTVVCKLITKTNLNPGLRKQLNSFLLQLTKKHFEFSAAGFFHVNRQMLTSMAATVATNL